MAIITISRGTMSGGRAVAECLADQLGYPCVANRVVRDAALSLGLPEDVVREKFETTPHLWSRLNKDRQIYLLAMKAALADRCLKGDLVYHGLAGQFLLADLPAVLRVRLIAPMAKRIEYLTTEHHRLTVESAREFIENVDRERKRWVKVFFDADVEDPFLYDVTVNQRWLTVETACTGIAELAGHSIYEVTDEVRDKLEAFAARCHKQLDARLSRGTGV
ncbi:MAG: cytidylate kinase-like family protein [Longimicrobiales bacterium]